MKKQNLDLEQIGKNINELRRLHKVTVMELSKLIFNTQEGENLIHSWESGEKLISLEELVKICNIFGTNPSAILFS